MLSANFPQIQEQWITLQGARVRYLRCGSGPALVMQHGLLGYAFSWRFAMPALGDCFTVFAPDNLGSGFSDRPRGLDHSLRACAERLLRLLDGWGVERCDLLGSSHGGAMAMRAASLEPERVRRLVLVSPVNPWSAHGRLLGPFLGLPIMVPLFRSLGPHFALAHGAILRRLFGDERRIRPGTLEGYAAPFRVPGGFDHGLTVMRSWRPDLAELEAALPRIAHIPTLLMWGTRDVAVSPQSAEPLRRQFRDCRLVWFEGVGHVPYEEVPEEFNRTVREFLVR